jgi:hypothetical protein
LRGGAACQSNRLPPIPCRRTVRTSISGHATGRTRHPTVRPAGKWWNASGFRPFLRYLLSLPLSRRTLRQHRDNIWALEVISRLQMDGSLRQQAIEQVVLDLVSDDGGPLLSHGQSEAGQRSFDATCRKLFRFLTDPEISRDRSKPLQP